MIFYVVELLDDWNVDVPIWKYPRNLESTRVSSPGFGNDSKMMVMGDVTAQVAPELQRRMRTGIYLAVTAKRNRRSTASDLSRQLSSVTGTTVLRQTRLHENTIERHRYGGAGWLVWGGIILDSRTDLHVQSVTMTGHIHRDVNLEQHVRLFQGAMGAEFRFMDDNTRPHRANIVDECLQSEVITRMN
ncbi:transposable element Tcb2 transposase [Trichonephila clavipes]|nr:transposable element Tcb2 transposase [Trichonephila clavipes]